MSRAMNIQEADLQHIPTVEFTDTWRPVHHVEVVKAVQKACDERSLVAVSKNYEISKDGKDMFASWQLPVVADSPHKAASVIGFRNSMKKRFALGLVAGHNVMVCSNMCFSGEFCEHRKHTSGLTPEVLLQFVMTAIESVLIEAQSFDDWFQNLAGVALTENKRKVLTYDLMVSGVIAPGSFSRFRRAYREELISNRQSGFESYAHFHGAVTRTLRGSSINQLQDRTRRLNQFVTASIEGNSEDVIDLIEA